MSLFGLSNTVLPYSFFGRALKLKAELNNKFLCRPSSSTTGSLPPKAFLWRQSGEWKTRVSKDEDAGNITWFGKESVVLSWEGSYGRNIAPGRISVLWQLAGGYYDEWEKLSGFYVQVRWRKWFYYKGAKIDAPGFVVGVIIQTIGDTKYFLCITTINSSGEGIDELYRKPIFEGDWELVFTWNHPNDVGLHDTGWFANASGTEARCIIAARVVVNGQARINHHQFILDLVNLSVSRIDGQTIINSRSWTSELKCESSPYTYNGSSDSITLGSRIIAVDYKGDTLVTATLNVDAHSSSQQTGSTIDDFPVLETNESSSGSEESVVTLKFSGKSVTLSQLTQTTGRAYDSGSDLLSDISESINVTAFMYYLDLRFDEALFVEWTRHINRSHINSDLTYEENSQYKLTLLSRGVLTEGVNVVSTSTTSGQDNLWVMSADCFDGPEFSFQSSGNEQVESFRQATSSPIKIGTVHIPTSVIGIDPQGNRFVSIPHDTTYHFDPGYSNFLTDGDPAIITELTGDNPRFAPIYVV